MRPVTRKKKPVDATALAHLVASVPPDHLLATLAKSIPDPDGWHYELKYDGYRYLAYCNGGNVQLLSRSARDWTADFPEVVDALRRLRLRDCVIDGELCAIDPTRHVPDFNLLQNRAAGVHTMFAAFDLLWQGKDLRREPIEMRQAALGDLLDYDSSATVFTSLSTDGDPTAILKLACDAGYEGIIAKKRRSFYSGGRSRTWLKLKCTCRQEFAVAGYLAESGSTGVGALLLAVRDGKRFKYAGKVGTGFSTAQREHLARELDQDRVVGPSVDDVPQSIMRREPRWSTVRLVVEVAYYERTTNQLRHPTFKGLRQDKKPADCVWETPTES